ncbi:NADH-ubiquinone oxidoreductase chain 5 [Melipona quadrifasciata]|uniref:NADH:ubiquinone reductase (H(+)-translocating) n=1 Tax=Melipona quadrifasciata TaxID=166423 RepID=A0A0M8ZQS3_9HYME|nr:NADH-ubiquinone oxidoreductase chain 5 [Melipona quadrifasciata]
MAARRETASSAEVARRKQGAARIPQIRVSNTRLAQAASGCAPSVDVLPIFDVKQRRVCGTPLGWVRTSLVGLVTTTKASRVLGLTKANFGMDFKKIIALSTLSQLGLTTRILRFGLIELAFLHLFIRAPFKSIMFICAERFIRYIKEQVIRIVSRGMYCFLIFVGKCMCVCIRYWADRRLRIAYVMCSIKGTLLLLYHQQFLQHVDEQSRDFAYSLRRLYRIRGDADGECSFRHLPSLGNSSFGPSRGEYGEINVETTRSRSDACRLQRVITDDGARDVQSVALTELQPLGPVSGNIPHGKPTGHSAKEKSIKVGIVKFVNTNDLGFDLLAVADNAAFTSAPTYELQIMQALKPDKRTGVEVA